MKWAQAPCITRSKKPTLQILRNGVAEVVQPKINDKLIEHYLDLCERHPTWTFGQIASGLHIDAATLRQLETVTNSKLRSAKVR